jgi:anti-sigma factor RsiW
VDGERLVAGLRCSEVLADLSDYIDGVLPPERREQLESHVRGCAYCEQFGGRFAHAIRTLRRALASPDALDAGVAQRLRDRLHRSTK